MRLRLWKEHHSFLLTSLISLIKPKGLDISTWYINLHVKIFSIGLYYLFNLIQFNSMNNKGGPFYFSLPIKFNFSLFIGGGPIPPILCCVNVMLLCNLFFLLYLHCTILSFLNPSCFSIDTLLLGARLHV